MAVYVDNLQLPFGRMKMCHMVADTREELFDMVDKIGVQRKWIQDFGSKREHYDISLTKRALAVKNGAIGVGAREIVRITNNRDMNSYLNKTAPGPTIGPVSGKC